MKQFFLVILALSFSTISIAHADPGFEMEVDPLAYLMKGFSLHGAATFKTSRVDLGVFGIEVPQAIHGNNGFKNSTRGFGMKYDVFGARLNGVFVGIDGGYMRTRFEHLASGEVAYRNQFGIGPRVGYRFGTEGFYVSPWVSISYVFRGDEVSLGGEKFHSTPVQIFPTVHIGYRF